MKKAILFLFFSGQAVLGLAQNEEHKYIRVPEKFEFLNEENKFELNALTAFLFEKYGFEVFYKNNPPANVHPCQILAADVEENSGLFKTKVVVTLEDCNQRAVFISEEGSSRIKDYKKAYHEALRDAFESLKDFDPEPVALSADGATASMAQSAGSKSAVAKGESKEFRSSASLAPSSNRTFRNGEQEYYLHKRSSGYDLYKAGEDEKFASLLKSGSGTNYIYSSKNVQGNAFFDPSGNLLVEFLDSDTGQLFSVRYELQDQ